MAGSFDLAEAIAERAAKVEPFELRLGDNTFTLSPIVTNKAIASLRSGSTTPLTDFFSHQMDSQDFEDWEDLDLDLDQLVQGQIMFAYFDHIGYDNPFTRDGRLASAERLGEGVASNRGSRRAAKR